MIPDQAVWRNFIDAWRLIDFPRSFFNSFMVSVPTALLTVVVCSMAAYAMTRMKFKYATAVFMIYLSTMMIPMVVRLIPSFILVKNMDLWIHIWGWYYRLLHGPCHLEPFDPSIFLLVLPKWIEWSCICWRGESFPDFYQDYFAEYSSRNDLHLEHMYFFTELE